MSSKMRHACPSLRVPMSGHSVQHEQKVSRPSDHAGSTALHTREERAKSRAWWNSLLVAPGRSFCAPPARPLKVCIRHRRQHPPDEGHAQGCGGSPTPAVASTDATESCAGRMQARTGLRIAVRHGSSPQRQRQRVLPMNTAATSSKTYLLVFPRHLTGHRSPDRATCFSLGAHLSRGRYARKAVSPSCDSGTPGGVAAVARSSVLFARRCRGPPIAEEAEHPRGDPHGLGPEHGWLQAGAVAMPKRAGDGHTPQNGLPSAAGPPGASRAEILLSSTKHTLRPQTTRCDPDGGLPQSSSDQLAAASLRLRGALSRRKQTQARSTALGQDPVGNRKGGPALRNTLA